ncbi:uncharacterized protein LOC125490157 [Plutella xylostella]|uniref:uncharacterized protein LOC125490157 n=1 Tax=Plutella xylostella TaxID=51655 RepID=UPI00203230DA|nr:uncharacterized protein LOC125490157 [Plutella xylostella]
MDRFTGPQRAFCVKQFYLNHFSPTIVRRLFRSEYDLHDLNLCPSVVLIKKWVEKFEETGSTLNMKREGTTRTTRSEENVLRVSDSVRQNPDLSTRKRSAELGIPRTSVRRILKLDLKLHPYKIQLVQELKPNDLNLRKLFAETMLERFKSFNNILFSDEAHFHLNGHVNKQNCRYWSTENPKAKHERPLHSPKVTVWAAISSKGIIGPYFFEDSRGRTITVNSAEYVKMLREFLSPQLQEFDGYNSRTWFQQDGATCHTSNESLPVVKELFSKKLISRRGDIPWPPRSPDLSPADFFLWGYLKQRVYNHKPRALRELKEKIREEMAAIPKALCDRVLTNFHSRLQECLSRDGGHLNDIIFKK